jgi:predicted ArsR family transcriptional regulator
MLKTLKISKLEQVRLLSDPLKLQLLQAFAENAKTTKQVAAELGESVTKLYRHVDALQAADLLTVVSEQQKRGTLERTFRTVAERFEVEQSLFSPDSIGGNDAIRDMLRAGEEEIITALSQEQGNQQEPLVMRMRVKASSERLQELRQLLQDWIESATNSENDLTEESEKTIEMGALIAFYPLNKNK